MRILKREQNTIEGFSIQFYLIHFDSPVILNDLFQVVTNLGFACSMLGKSERKNIIPNGGMKKW